MYLPEILDWGLFISIYGSTMYNYYLKEIFTEFLLHNRYILGAVTNCRCMARRRRSPSAWWALGLRRAVRPAVPVRIRPPNRALSRTSSRPYSSQPITSWPWNYSVARRLLWRNALDKRQPATGSYTLVLAFGGSNLH